MDPPKHIYGVEPFKDLYLFFKLKRQALPEEIQQAYDAKVRALDAAQTRASGRGRGRGGRGLVAPMVESKEDAARNEVRRCSFPL
jgi:hypothetical protein